MTIDEGYHYRDADFISTDKPVCAICGRVLKETPPTYGVPIFDRLGRCTSINLQGFGFDGKRIDFEFESFWVCNDCLEEVKHE